MVHLRNNNKAQQVVLLTLLLCINVRVYVTLAHMPEILIKHQTTVSPGLGHFATHLNEQQTQNLQQQRNSLLQNYEETERYTNNTRSNIFQIINEWKYLDFEYPTYTRRQQAIALK